MLTMPVDAIPDLSENQVIVFTDWMGRSPQEIEDQVTYPLSVKLQGLAGVKVVRSSSEFNFSMITIIFDDETDYYFARQRVLEKLLDRRDVPAAGRDAVPRPRRHGRRPDLLVHRRGGRQGPGRAAGDPGLVRPLPAQQRAGRGRGRHGRRGAAASTRSTSTRTSSGPTASASARSTRPSPGRTRRSAAGSIHKGNAEYLVRAVGWIENLDDIREHGRRPARDGTPIYVEQPGHGAGRPGVPPQRAGEGRQGGRRRRRPDALRREPAGGHAAGQGEDPRRSRPGLPEGVRIVPFYDRTPLIHKAIETVSGTVKEELIVCTIAILLVMGHVGSAFVVAVTLPLAVLFSFLMMRLFGMSSNIMRLAGIAISRRHPDRPGGRDGRERRAPPDPPLRPRAGHAATRPRSSSRPAGRSGRPIFFSVLITILSFLPVFALTGREGKMFHPLAFTKTFALVGVAVLSITLVPALIPIFLKGRIKSEDENWLVRTMIEIFKPMLAWLMDRTTLVCWLFVVILGLGYVASTRLGREFMPDLDEQSDHGHADDRAPRRRSPQAARRPPGPRRGPPRLPRGLAGRRQGGPGRDADRPGRRST